MNRLSQVFDKVIGKVGKQNETFASNAKSDYRDEILVNKSPQLIRSDLSGRSVILRKWRETSEKKTMYLNHLS